MELLTVADLETMTLDAGENWALPHVRRVLRLAEEIGIDLNYDAFAFTVAAYLHDWGAFPRYQQPGVDHALRSRQVAEVDILPQMDLTSAQIALILETIEMHDYRDLRPATSAEALLLREADFLDFLGVIGLARVFAWGPNDLAVCYRRILARRDALRDRFNLPRAQAIATTRLARMEQCLAWLEEESFGHL
ncbi:MAG: HD domain-containing protein [Anaerolineae bacterium]